MQAPMLAVEETADAFGILLAVELHLVGRQVVVDLAYPVRFDFQRRVVGQRQAQMEVGLGACARGRP